MNSKKMILLSCVVPCVFAVSTATAQMRGHRASTARMPMHRAPMLNSASGFQRWHGGDFDRDDRFRRFNRFRDFDRDDRFRRFNRFRDFDRDDRFGRFNRFRDFDRDDRFGRFNRFRDFDRDDRFRRFNRFNRFVFIDTFGFPFFYPYPYHPYPYWDYYSYGYGYQGYGNGSSVVQLQRRLARAGYYHGAFDGIMGAATRRALRAYERDHNQRAYGMTNRY
jgi:hypothetical protein